LVPPLRRAAPPLTPDAASGGVSVARTDPGRYLGPRKPPEALRDPFAGLAGLG